MVKWFKHWLERYDQWCESMGLTPENKRSCVPYRKEMSGEEASDKAFSRLKTLDENSHGRG